MFNDKYLKFWRNSVNNVTHDEKSQRYSVHLEGEYYATLAYQQVDGVMHITSTKVPEALQGKGYGKVLMEAVLPEIERAGYKVVPICSYVKHYLQRNPRWQSLAA
ncbi:N-acetyltransferase [Vibrio navarrensis]|nr:N-acetyltransferase [Vibrio navarrensis]